MVVLVIEGGEIDNLTWSRVYKERSYYFRENFLGLVRLEFEFFRFL